MATLFELSDAYMVLKESLENATEAANEAGVPVESYYEDVFKTIQDDLKTKAVGYAKVMSELELEIKGLKEQEDAWAKKRKRKENALAQIKNNLMFAMKQTGETKFEKEGFRFSVVKNGGKAPLKLKVDEKDIPEIYKTQKWVLNNDSLRELCASEPENQYCYLDDRGERLQVK